MSPAAETLLAILRDEPLPDARDHAATPDLAGAVLLAEEHGLAPWVAHRLREAGGAPENLLAATERQSTRDSFFWTNQLRGLLAAFHAAGLPVLLLKGPFLAQRLYGSPALRPSRDLDLLVQPGTLPRAEDLLRAQGFTPRGRGDDYHRTWTRDTAAVELHFQVEHPLAFPFPLAEAWTRALPDTFAGEPCLRLQPADEFLFLALHAARHRFDRLSLPLDLALHRRLYPTPPPGEGPLAGVVLLGNLMADHLTGAPTSAPGTRLARHLRPIAAQLWQQLLSGRQPALSWQAQHRFFVSLEPTPAGRMLRRMRHAQILAGRLIDADHAFAERFGLRRTWQARLLRPIRLLLSRR